MGDSESRAKEGNTENEPEDFIQGKLYTHVHTNICIYVYLYIIVYIFIYYVNLFYVYI